MLFKLWNTLRQRTSRLRADSPQLALDRFHRHRAEITESFFQLAAASGTPRGLKWLACEWQTQQEIVRETTSGLLTLLLAVNVRFDAIQGGDMEGVAAVDTVRDGTAVFHYQNGRWGSGGRVLFNLTPSDALARLGDSFQPIGD